MRCRSHLRSTRGPSGSSFRMSVADSARRPHVFSEEIAVAFAAKRLGRNAALGRGSPRKPDRRRARARHASDPACRGGARRPPAGGRPQDCHRRRRLSGLSAFAGGGGAHLRVRPVRPLRAGRRSHVGEGDREQSLSCRRTSRCRQPRRRPRDRAHDGRDRRRDALRSSRDPPPQRSAFAARDQCERRLDQLRRLFRAPRSVGRSRGLSLIAAGPKHGAGRGPVVRHRHRFVQ